jgi:diguanylate cyclase (GGDEF)-like protein
MAAMLVPLVVVAGAGFFTFRASVDALEDFRAETVGESAPIVRMRELLAKVDDVGESLVENDSLAMGWRFSGMRNQIDEGFTELQTLSSPRERSLAEAADRRWAQTVAAINVALDLPDSFVGDKLDDFHDRLDEAGQLLADAQALNMEEVAGEISAFQHRERSQLLAALAILLISSMAAGLLARRVRRSIVGPLTSLEKAASEFGSADLSHRISVTGDDELARVSHAFNAMAGKLQQSRAAMQELALHDPLTGLPNRRLFIERMEHAIARSDRTGKPFSVLYLDLDGFKGINDSLGHEAGDELLVAVAEQLKRSLRASDTAARLGGDEFAILLEEADLTAATETTHRLSVSFASSGPGPGSEVPTALSIGAATRQKGEQLDHLLHQADAAMYAAKARGAGHWQVFGSDANASVIETKTLTRDLQAAIEREEFVVHYQPIVNLQTEALEGIEALVRWNHPERGILPPSEFLQEAEKSDQILHIDRWVLREACRQVHTWQEVFPGAADLFVCVNVSAKLLQNSGFADVVSQALTASGLAAKDLIIEITETALVTDTEAAFVEIARIKELGVKLALDDFGAGYSSMTHLQTFPIDIIKIDRSFVSAIGDEQRSKVALALVKVAETLQLTTVAEGIDSEVQLEYLRALDCQFGQGYHFAKPLSRLRLETLWLKNLSQPRTVQASSPRFLTAIPGGMAEVEKIILDNDGEATRIAL